MIRLSDLLAIIPDGTISLKLNDMDFFSINPSIALEVLSWQILSYDVDGISVGTPAIRVWASYKPLAPEE